MDSQRSVMNRSLINALKYMRMLALMMNTKARTTMNPCMNNNVSIC